MTDSAAEHELGQEKGDNRRAMRTRVSRCFGKKGGCEDGYLVPDRATDIANRKHKMGEELCGKASGSCAQPKRRT